MDDKTQSSPKLQPKRLFEPDISLKDLYNLAEKIIKYRGRNLLLLYYCDADGEIWEHDIPILHEVLSQSLKLPLEELDVLIHTKGGHPNSAYLLIQTIRKFAKRIYFIVPKHAYSGGTLMALGSDKICLGPYASLGPIDVQAYGGKFPLLSIEKFVEFVKHAHNELIPCGDPSCHRHKSFITDALLLELTKEFSPTEIGHLFNLRRLSEYYATVLLNDYMFKNDENRKSKVEGIVKRLNSSYPSHDFDIDIHISKGLGLKVELMETDLFDLTDTFINICDILKKKGEICPFLPRDKLENKAEDFRIAEFRLFMQENKRGDNNGKKG